MKSTRREIMATGGVLGLAAAALADCRPGREIQAGPSQPRDVMDWMLEFVANRSIYEDRFTPELAWVFDFQGSPRMFECCAIDVLTQALDATLIARGKETLLPTFGVCSRRNWRQIRELLIDTRHIIRAMNGLDERRCLDFDGFPVFWDKGMDDRNEHVIYVVNWPSMKLPRSESKGLNAIIMNTHLS